MSKQDITIMTNLLTQDGKRIARLYYYQGNFYFPFMGLHPSQRGKVGSHIKRFRREHAELVNSDRSHPDYQTLTELFDSQPCSV